LFLREINIQDPWI